MEVLYSIESIHWLLSLFLSRLSANQVTKLGMSSQILKIPKNVNYGEKLRNISISGTFAYAPCASQTVEAAIAVRMSKLSEQDRIPPERHR